MNPLYPAVQPDAIRCVRCLGVLTDDDELVRTPGFIAGEANVAHRECPGEETP